MTGVSTCLYSKSLGLCDVRTITGFTTYYLNQTLSWEKESSTMKPQVIVADDHRLVAEGVVKILEKEYTVVATPTDGRGFIEAVEKFRPHPCSG